MFVNISDRLGTQKIFLGTFGIRQKMVLMQVEQGFSSFFAQIVGIFEDFSKFHSKLHFEKSTNMPKTWAKNEEKPCSTCLKPNSP